MPYDPKQLVKQYEKRRGERANFDARHEIMAPFIAPSRKGIQAKLSPGEKLTGGVYDSTGLFCAELMAQFIAGYIINPAQRWFSYVPRNPNLVMGDEEREFAEECRDRTMKRLSASFFYAEGTESLTDYVGFGTGYLLNEENPQPSNRTVKGFRGFHFEAIRTGQCVIAEGTDGLVDDLRREFMTPVGRIAERFPNATLHEDMRRALKSDPDQPFKLLHCILPRPKAEQGGMTAKGMPWGSVWIDYDHQTILDESGYPAFPVAVPRYHRNGDTPYGFGRGDYAFPDLQTLNSAKRMGLEDWALKIKPPPLVRSDSVIGSLKLRPGEATSINTHGKPISDVIMPWQTGSHPEVSQINEENLRKSIRQIFFVDQILMLLEVSKSEMTAFEFRKKIELLFRILGPVYGRLEWEKLYRVVDQCFALQMLAGDFPPPPASLKEEDSELGLVFDNPLANAQRGGDAEAVTMIAGDIGPLVETYPEMLDWVDPDETMLGLMSIRGWPAKWTRNRTDVEKKRAARAEQNQRELAVQEGAQVASAVKDVAPALQILQGGKA